MPPGVHFLLTFNPDFVTEFLPDCPYSNQFACAVLFNYWDHLILKPNASPLIAVLRFLISLGYLSADIISTNPTYFVTTYTLILSRVKTLLPDNDSMRTIAATAFAVSLSNTLSSLGPLLEHDPDFRVVRCALDLCIFPLFAASVTPLLGDILRPFFYLDFCELSNCFLS
jgi:hypothetical protein